ncbi:MAG: iron-containing alcohol dehydrogenase [Bacteroidetes bacterium]|nr:iron-containing alcohol dehydrogenase [Bacteroidota bacterium]
MTILETGIRSVRNVPRYRIGKDSINELDGIIQQLRLNRQSQIIFFIDEFFRERKEILNLLPIKNNDIVWFVATKEEPTTDGIDAIMNDLRVRVVSEPLVIVGMGGGITMDVAKAVSLLFTNPGCAKDYQGWDLVKKPGIFKIAIPTLSGTGAEATRTCVITNTQTGLKLGMNSDYTVYDYILMDSNLTQTVPRDQYFFTGMDAYIHCIESLAGSYRNAIGDAYSRETINLCRQVFSEGDMQAPVNREKLMVASYLGGCAIATSYVGLIHPLSAGLSVVLGVHHCVGNCIVMRAMADFYPDAYDEFWNMAERQRVKVPEGICRKLKDDDFRALYHATLLHQKPLTNALGENYKSILTQDRVTELFKRM